MCQIGVVFCQNTIESAQKRVKGSCGRLLGMWGVNERKRGVVRERFCCLFSLRLQAASVRAGLAF